MHNIQILVNHQGFDVTIALRSVLSNRSKSLDFYGKVMCFFFLSFLMTYYVAIRNVILAKDPDHQIELDLFTYILPFVSFIIDAAVKRAYHLQVRSFIIFLKIIMIFFYLSFYVIALQRTSESIVYWVATGNFFVFPVVMTLYWFGLINNKLS